MTGERRATGEGGPQDRVDWHAAGFLHAWPCVDAASVREPNRTATVSLVGEHDLSTADSLEHRVVRHLDRCDRLVVDLSEVGFMDSSAVRALVRVAILARARGIAFEVVASEQAQSHGVLELLGLMGYFTLRASCPSTADGAHEPPAHRVVGLSSSRETPATTR